MREKYLKQASELETSYKDFCENYYKSPDLRRDKIKRAIDDVKTSSDLFFKALDELNNLCNSESEAEVCVFDASYNNCDDALITFICGLREKLDPIIMRQKEINKNIQRKDMLENNRNRSKFFYPPDEKPILDFFPNFRK